MLFWGRILDCIYLISIIIQDVYETKKYMKLCSDFFYQKKKKFMVWFQKQIKLENGRITLLKLCSEKLRWDWYDVC